MATVVYKRIAALLAEHSRDSHIVGLFTGLGAN